MIKAKPVMMRVFLALTAIALCLNTVTSQAFAAEDEIDDYDLNPGTELAVEGG